MSTPFRRMVVATGVGRLVLVADGDALCGVYLPGHRVAPERAQQGRLVDRDELLEEAGSQLQDYLTGTRLGFDLPLAPLPDGLGARVRELLLAIAPGETRSYGELAADLGDPHLAQAVGQAVGRNPLSLVVPCHRVVGSDGGYTGFAGGEALKAWLLAHEAHLVGRALLPPEPYRPPQRGAATRLR